MMLLVIILLAKKLLLVSLPLFVMKLLANNSSHNEAAYDGCACNYAAA
jgi:hypothetical protein